ncbi:MAG: hypothetical protein ACXWZR_20295 [Mycobacterium sp.]
MTGAHGAAGEYGHIPYPLRRPKSGLSVRGARRRPW